MPSKPTLSIKLDADSSDLIKEFLRVKKANEDLERSNKRLSGSFDNLAKGAKKLAAAYLSFEGIRTAGVYAVNTAAQFETLNTSLATVFGSQERANIKFKELNEFAANTPFTIQEITEAAIQMKSLGLDPSIRALESMGNTASALGKPLMQFTEAVADAVVGEFERLKEFGIKASSEGDRVKFTFRGMTTEIGKNADEINEYLMNIGETEFAGAIEKQADTIAGRFSTLGGVVDQLAVKFAGESGLTQAVKDATEAITQFLTDTFLTGPTVEGLTEEIDAELEKLNELSANMQQGGVLTTGISPVEVEETQNRIMDLMRQRAELIVSMREEEAEAAKHEERITKIKEKEGKRRIKQEARDAKRRQEKEKSDFEKRIIALSSYSEAASNINKVFKARDAIIDAHAGAQKTMAAYPYPINVAMAGLHYVQAFAIIRAMQSESSSPGTGGGGAGQIESEQLPETVSDAISTEDEPVNKTIYLNIDGVDDDALLTKNQVRMIVDQINEEREANVRIVL